MRCKNCEHQTDRLYYSGNSEGADFCEDCYTDFCAEREQENNRYLETERFDEWLAVERYEFGQEE